ncbi:MAG: 4Fe-4S ferredoxin [Peptococcaceae bacterium]|nr:4Fe-4S ferredoxin [Peptococcaceae bacterium]
MEDTIKVNKLPETNNPEVKNIIFYYTGTGNSLWIARTLAEKIGNTELKSIMEWDNKTTIYPPVVGIIFPVHIWGIPHRVLKFINELGIKSPEYIFAVANNAGQVSNTLVQMKKVMRGKDIKLSGGWSVVMPSNYIPWGGPGTADQQNSRFQQAEKTLSNIAEKVTNRVIMPVEKGPIWQRLLFTGLYKLAFPYVAKMDNRFWVTEDCNHCNICIKICPSKNIKLEDNQLLWSNNCEQCLSCIQWCPKEAIQYGKRTIAYHRYHHPQIKLSDLIK